MRKSLTLLATVCLCLVTAAYRDQAEGVAPTQGQLAVGHALTAQEAEGRRLYDFYCSLCHGSTGEGDGFNAWNLDPRPEPFKRNPLVEGVADEDLATVIRAGGRSVGKSVLMPPWGDTLAGAEIDALVAYLRVLVTDEPAQRGQEDGAPDHE